MKAHETRSRLTTQVLVAVVLHVCVVVAAPGGQTADDLEPRADDTLGPGHDDLTALQADDLGESQRMRDEKLFIALVQIQPDQCTTNDGFSTLGTCMPAKDCTNSGGTASGTCAKGLGVCCLVTRRCSSSSRFNNTYFVNPTNDSLGACTLTINRMNANICQLRLDFIYFDLSQPDATGQCSVDFFTVQGTSTMICGSNTGQHMYVNVDSNGGAIKLSVDRSTAAPMNRLWNIKVSQIECNSRFRAPNGCLQYFTETSGTVSSFNYDTVLVNGTRQIRNMDYGVCILPPDGYCGIIWEKDPTSIYSFSVSGALDALDPRLIGTTYAVSRNCTTDYVIIPGGIEDTGIRNDRYCGLGFPNSVMSYAMPYVLYVTTGGDETGDTLNRGFRLNYRLTTICA